MTSKTVKGNPIDPENPDMWESGSNRGYGGEVATDRLCMLHQQSVRLNKQMSELAEISRNMLQVQMAQSQTLNNINERLKLLENLTNINENIEKSTAELDKLEDVMRAHAEDQKKNTDLFVETSHAMIEAFNGEDISTAAEKGAEKARTKRAEADRTTQ